MATNFNTRIKLKYDTYANWTSTNPILLKGELAVVEVPAESGTGLNEPAYLLKVGDGIKKFAALDWISGKAADVYAWAKAASKPTYQASEIQGLEDFISGEVQDTNTKYQIVKNGNMGFKLQSKEIGEKDWTDVSDITLVAPTVTLTTGDTNGTVKFNGTDVPVAGLGSAAYTQSTAYDAAGAATGVKTELLGTAEDPSTANTIAGVKKYTDEKVAAAQTAASGALAALDLAAVSAGQGQIISSISQTDGLVAASTRALVAADIPEIGQEKVTGLTAALAGKQDTLVFNTTYNATSNKAATMTDVANAVAGLSGAMHYVGESTTDPATSVTIDEKPEYSPASGDVVTYQAKEYVYDGEAWRLLGDESSYAVKGAITDADISASANISMDKIGGLNAALAGKATPANITEAIGALDVVDSEVANQFVTAVSETDGKIAVTRKALTAADIPAITTDKVTGLDTALAGKADASTVTQLGQDIDALETLVGSTNVTTQITSAIGALDKEDSAVANQFVTAVSEADGIITVTRAQHTITNVNGLQAALDAKVDAEDLAEVATTGKMDDLTQNATIVFDCGTSTTAM